MDKPQRILVPTDFSQFSGKAFEEALLLAQQFKADIDFLHVVEDIQQCAVDYCLTQELLDQYRASGVSNSKEKLQKIIESNREAKDVRIIPNVRVGEPYKEILKEEEEKMIDLIVIATHGKTGFIQNLMGSVADRVSRQAKGQVLLVKP